VRLGFAAQDHPPRVRCSYAHVCNVRVAIGKQLLLSALNSKALIWQRLALHRRSAVECRTGDV